MNHDHINLLTNIFWFLMIFLQALQSLSYSNSPGSWSLTQERGSQGSPPSGRSLSPQGSPPSGRSLSPQGSPPSGRSLSPQGSPPSGRSLSPQGSPPSGRSLSPQGSPPSSPQGSKKKRKETYLVTYLFLPTLCLFFIFSKLFSC